MDLKTQLVACCQKLWRVTQNNNLFSPYRVSLCVCVFFLELTGLFCFVSFYETYTLFIKKKNLRLRWRLKNGVTLMSYKMTQFMSGLAHVTSCGGSMWGHSFITYNLSHQLYHFMRYKLCHFIRQQHMKFFFLLQSIGL